MVESVLKGLEAIERPDSEAHFEGYFTQIATFLMQETVLRAENQHYRFTELEFYFQSKDHPDPFCHNNDLQKSKWQWYFHPSGIDITFGGEEAFGGILIRGVRKIDIPQMGIDAEDFVSGPVNVIRDVFSNIGSIESGTLRLGLEYLKGEKSPIVQSSRIGIKKENDTLDYHGRLYRFITDVQPMHQFEEKEVVSKNMLLKNPALSIDSINRIMGGNVLKPEPTFSGS